MPSQDAKSVFFIGTLEIPNAKYTVRRQFIGDWRIVSMSEWSSDHVDMVRPAKLHISSTGYGTISFGAFDGVIDAMADELRQEDSIQFSFYGTDEDEEVCGRGFAVEAGGTLEGRICFHRGMTSTFVAKKMPKKRPIVKRSKRQSASNRMR